MVQPGSRDPVLAPDWSKLQLTAAGPGADFAVFGTPPMRVNSCDAIGREGERNRERIRGIETGENRWERNQRDNYDQFH